MSFTYAVLFGEMQTALLACGLDPHIGLFHELRKSHLALASDLIEPYRHLIGDSFVLKLVNNRMVKTDGFVEGERKAVYMHPDTRRLVLVAFEDFMRKPLKPGSSDTFSFGPRHLITLAAHAMLRIVIGETQELVLPLKEVHDANWKSCDADSDDI
jgi:CRISPR-associated endonuclease Cas1